MRSGIRRDRDGCGTEGCGGGGGGGNEEDVVRKIVRRNRMRRRRGITITVDVAMAAIVYTYEICYVYTDGCWCTW